MKQVTLITLAILATIISPILGFDLRIPTRLRIGGGGGLGGDVDIQQVIDNVGPDESCTGTVSLISAAGDIFT